jgi:hypothetical protein
MGLKARMKPYDNLNGNSGVIAYAFGPAWVIAKFQDGWNYEYTVKSAGAPAIAKMTRLAEAGRGLSTYVSQEVKDKYARKFR